MESWVRRRGFASTLADLARWARNLYTRKAFDTSLLPMMLDGVPALQVNTSVGHALGGSPKGVLVALAQAAARQVGGREGLQQAFLSSL